jgi:hypothetical protein
VKLVSLVAPFAISLIHLLDCGCCSLWGGSVCNQGILNLSSCSAVFCSSKINGMKLPKKKKKKPFIH